MSDGVLVGFIAEIYSVTILIALVSVESVPEIESRLYQLDRRKDTGADIRHMIGPDVGKID